MAKITPISEQFQHFLEEMKDSFWGDLYGQTKLAWKKYFEAESERLRDRYSGWAAYERGGRAQRDYRNGYYERDFVTRFGTIRLHCPHPGEELSAAGTGEVSAPGPGAGDVDSGSVFARHLDPPGGTGGGHAERRSGERANRLATDARSGRGGAAVSSGATGR